VITKTAVVKQKTTKRGKKILWHVTFQWTARSWDSSVGIVLGYRLDDQGFKS
jgi:hypothetical protein